MACTRSVVHRQHRLFDRSRIESNAFGRAVSEFFGMAHVADNQHRLVQRFTTCHDTMSGLARTRISFVMPWHNNRDSGHTVKLFVRGMTANQAKGPSVQIVRAIGPGRMGTTGKRPERPTVRSNHERSTLWASGTHVGSQTWADGPGV
jgi:hypothetical protein